MAICAAYGTLHTAYLRSFAVSIAPHVTASEQSERPYYIAALVLLPAALLINLGLMTFIDDEAIRSLVALEMKLSGNYITPTLNGEYYYNKPPLYNWILLAFFSIAGKFDEFTARIPTLVSLCGFAATVFFVFKPKYGARVAFINAFALITCGRILFWDSILGLIDICFSWVMFGLFMVVYHEFRRGNFMRLFLLTYLLTAVGFLMKGLPALVFQAFTLLAYFVYKREFRRLFSAGHFLGIGLLALIVGGYYLVYHQYNDLGNVFTTLFDESYKRTGARFGLKETALHLLSFPFEMVYHFLPWSLMILYFFMRGVHRQLLRDEFITFNLITFLANIVVYWTSPEVYPRYLLMLAPLLFSAFVFLHEDHAARRSAVFRVVDGFFLVFLTVMVVGSIAPAFLERTRQAPFLFAKTAFLFSGSAILFALYLRQRDKSLLVMIVALLLMRVGFNWYVLPDRNAEDWGNLCRQSTIEAGAQFRNRPVYIYGDTELQYTNAFYLTNARGQIVSRAAAPTDPSAVYIIDPGRYPALPYRKVGEFKYRHGMGVLHLGVFSNTSENQE